MQKNASRQNWAKIIVPTCTTDCIYFAVSIVFQWKLIQFPSNVLRSYLVLVDSKRILLCNVTICINRLVEFMWHTAWDFRSRKIGSVSDFISFLLFFLIFLYFLSLFFTLPIFLPPPFYISGSLLICTSFCSFVLNSHQLTCPKSLSLFTLLVCDALHK